MRVVTRPTSHDFKAEEQQGWKGLELRAQAQTGIADSGVFRMS